MEMSDTTHHTYDFWQLIVSSRSGVLCCVSGQGHNQGLVGGQAKSGGEDGEMKMVQ